MSFIYFSCLIALTRTFSTILNKNYKSRHACLVPVIGESFQSLTIKYNVRYGVFVEALYQVEIVPFCPYFIEFLKSGKNALFCEI